jgi:hypothetical protein
MDSLFQRAPSQRSTAPDGPRTKTCVGENPVTRRLPKAMVGLMSRHEAPSHARTQSRDGTPSSPGVLPAAKTAVLDAAQSP